MPAGWLKRWARINADGWLLRYARHREPGVYDKLWNRNTASKITFTENNETVILCDYTAYFADGLMRYAALCPDSELAREAEPWLERLLASQDADGYLGAFQPQARWQHWLEIFSQSLSLEALLYRYEATGDAALLEACERAAMPLQQAWYRAGQDVNLGAFSGHGTILVKFLGRLYSLTGQRAYLRFAEDVLERYGMVKAFLQPGDALFGLHNVVGSEHAGFPAMLFEYSGEPALLEASRSAWELMARNHLSVDGTPHGNEAMEFKGPLHNCEHCSSVDWFQTSNALARMTGEVKYADAAERALYNAYPAAKSPDGLTVAYMHTPNQLVASEWSQPHAWTSPDWCASRQHYHSAHEPLCCNVNGPRGIPFFVESMVVRADDPGGAGLAVVYYGPCQIATRLPGAGQVTVRVDTDYPFEDDVAITVTPEQPAEFTLRVRIPGWCSAAQRPGQRPGCGGRDAGDLRADSPDVESGRPGDGALRGPDPAGEMGSLRVRHPRGRRGRPARAAGLRPAREGGLAAVQAAGAGAWLRRHRLSRAARLRRRVELRDRRRRATPRIQPLAGATRRSGHSASLGISSARPGGEGAPGAELAPGRRRRPSEDAVAALQSHAARGGRDGHAGAVRFHALARGVPALAYLSRGSYARSTRNRTTHTLLVSSESSGIASQPSPTRS